MSTVLIYAISLFLNLGIISPAQVNESTNIKIIQRDGKTIAVDPISDTEIIIY